MKQIKQFIAAFLCVATMVAATGCGKSDEGGSDKKGDGGKDGEVVTTVADTYEKYEDAYLEDSEKTFTSGDYEVKVYEGKGAISEYCGKETQVKIPSSIDGYKIFAIDLYAFEDALIERVEIPNGVALICDSAFWECEKLKEVVFPSTLQIIDDWAFVDCASLASLDFKNTRLSSIGSMAFNGCSSIKKIEFPNTLETIETQAFDGCTSLESIKLPENLKTLDSYVFSNCTSLKTAELPDSLTTLGGYTFDGCTALESIVIPESVTTIDGYTFRGCTSLKTVEIPKTVTTIDDLAFYNANPDMVIKCHKGSAADKFASEENFKVEYIG